MQNHKLISLTTIKAQYKPKLNEFVKKSEEAFLDHKPVGNLRIQEKTPLTKTVVSMPTGPLLGESSFQMVFIQHLCCRLRDELVGI